jgi:alkylation response protein AidB-like acyl-CoA dehydrogenase
MNFDISDEQQQLRDAVKKWVDKAYTFDRRRKIADAGGFSAEAYGELAELGLCGLYVPEADGGLGMGPVEGMVVMEELGRGIVCEPLAQALIAGGVLAGYAPAAVKAAWLPNVSSGEAIVVLAYQERGPSGRQSAGVFGLRCGRWQDGYVSGGRKSIWRIGTGLRHARRRTGGRSGVQRHARHLGHH